MWIEWALYSTTNLETMLFMSLYSNSYLFKQSAKNTKAQSVLLLLPQFCTRALASSKVWILSSGNCRDIYQGDRCDKCQHRSMLKIMTDWNTTRKRKDRSGLYCIVEDDFPTTVTTTAVVRRRVLYEVDDILHMTNYISNIYILGVWKNYSLYLRSVFKQFQVFPISTHVDL